jgi:hypothetical protein
MDKKPDILRMLPEKTQKDLDLFVINSCISTDEGKTNDFYNLIQRVIVETVTSQNKLKKNG